MGPGDSWVYVGIFCNSNIGQRYHQCAVPWSTVDQRIDDLEWLLCVKRWFFGSIYKRLYIYICKVGLYILPNKRIVYIYIYIYHPIVYIRIILGVYIVKGCIGGFAPLIHQVLPSRGWKNPCHTFPEPAESVGYRVSLLFSRCCQSCLCSHHSDSPKV